MIAKKIIKIAIGPALYSQQDGVVWCGIDLQTHNAA